MGLIEEHGDTLKYGALGVLVVFISGLLAYHLTPDTETGQIIRFLVPLILGILIGAKIYFRELSKVEEKLKNSK